MTPEQKAQLAKDGYLLEIPAIEELIEVSRRARLSPPMVLYYYDQQSGKVKPIEVTE